MWSNDTKNHKNYTGAFRAQELKEIKVLIYGFRRDPKTSPARLFNAAPGWQQSPTELKTGGAVRAKRWRLLLLLLLFRA